MEKAYRRCALLPAVTYISRLFPHFVTPKLPRAYPVNGACSSLQIATSCNERGMTVFCIADLHLGDERVAKARRFDNASAMGRRIALRWNETVSEGDAVYVLGDAARGGHMKSLMAFKGEKHLICGNADNIAEAMTAGVFSSISVAKWMRGAILTHIPVHPSQLRAGMTNIHGHLHGASVADGRYRCVSIEQTGFAPLPISSALMDTTSF